MTTGLSGEGRGRTYGLLGRLFLRGLAAELLPEARSLPGLAAAIPEPFEEDEAAADHQHLFGFNVFPYQSVFLDPSGLSGGPVTDSVVRCYQDAGYTADVRGESADHIGHELAFLSFLVEAEAEARREGGADEARPMARQQRRFLDEQLLRWLPPLVVAIWQQRTPFYSAAADLLLRVVQVHAEELGSDWAGEHLMPEAPALLDDPRTALGDIATYLVTPVASGLFLSRDGIGELARGHNLPRGFGGRRQMLLNLLRSAAEYDGLVLLLEAAQALVEEWVESYRQMGEGSAIEPFSRVWQARASETAGLLGWMREQVGEIEN